MLEEDELLYPSSSGMLQEDELESDGLPMGQPMIGQPMMGQYDLLFPYQDWEGNSEENQEAAAPLDALEWMKANNFQYPPQRLNRNIDMVSHKFPPNVIKHIEQQRGSWRKISSDHGGTYELSPQNYRECSVGRALEETLKTMVKKNLFFDDMKKSEQLAKDCLKLYDQAMEDELAKSKTNLKVTGFLNTYRSVEGRWDFLVENAEISGLSETHENGTVTVPVLAISAFAGVSKKSST